MLKTFITADLQIVSVPIPYTPFCVDCGGIRSYGSGQRCRRCFLVLSACKRDAKEATRLRAAAFRHERDLLKATIQQAQEAERAVRKATKWAEMVERQQAARAAKESARAARAHLVKARHRSCPRSTFQPFMFKFARVPSPSKVFKDALSLDAPLKTDRRFGVGSLIDTVADPTPNILEQMVSAEGVQRVIQRLSDEKHIPVEQARLIVEALVDSDLLEDGGVCDLADLLRGGWQANRLLSRGKSQPLTLAVKPEVPNPEPHQYNHWRRKYGLARSGHVIVRDISPDPFGGAWSVETAPPEEVEKIA